MFQYYSYLTALRAFRLPRKFSLTKIQDLSKSKFFTFVRPYLDYIDSGRFSRQPFCWLYSVLASIRPCSVFPLIVLAQSLVGVLHAGGKVVIAFIIAFLVLASVLDQFPDLVEPQKTGSCNRRSKAMIYIAIPVFWILSRRPAGLGRNMDRRCGRFAVVVVVFDFWVTIFPQ